MMPKGTPILCDVPVMPKPKRDTTPRKKKAKTVTLSDVADFVPQNAAVLSEPQGWALVGRSANFVARATTSVAKAKLLGHEARVRFTPVGYLWDYGDDTRRLTSSPGSTWASLGQNELTSTATGHVYRSRGDYDGSLIVEYAAAYRYGDGAWHTIPGEVAGPRTGFHTLVVKEYTALVAND